MNLGPHANFIIAAYTIAAIIVGVLIAGVLLDFQAQRNALADMEKHGVKRRSRRSRQT
jgi:heme exporter protein D